jgi:AcrR family transcriptional regulator
LSRQAGLCQCYKHMVTVTSGRTAAPRRRRAEPAAPALTTLLTVASAPDTTGDATTARILDAAYAEILTFGLRRASVEDIARRAGTARITIYRRFPGKDELVRAVLLREGQRVFAQVDAIIAGIDGTDEQIVEGFAAILAIARSHPLLQRLLVTEADLTVATLTTAGGPVIALGREYLAGHLQRAQEDGRLGPFDHRVAAEILVRLTLSFLLTPESCIPLDTDDQARAFARHLILPAVHPAAATPTTTSTATTSTASTPTAAPAPTGGPTP